MEDLSSLEGPPMRDERFSPLAVPVSPLSPYGGTYDPSRPLPLGPQVPISPLSTASRSLSDSISSLQFPIEDRLVRETNMERKTVHRNPEDVAFAAYKFLKQFPPGSPERRRVIPLRSSRSQAALRDAAQVPPRPASADNSSTAPFWLLVNGRLVWIEDMQLWVLWDEIDAARSYEKANKNSQVPVDQRPNRERGAWKSLPPLPHEIHHLLPPDSPSADRSNAKQKSRVSRHSSNTTNALLRGQWASLAGQLAPRTTTQSQRDAAPRMSQTTGNGNQLPRSLQPGYPIPPSQRQSPKDKRYYYH